MRKFFLAALSCCAMLVASHTNAVAEEHIVRVVTDYENLRMAFEPQFITIKPGDTVTWVNELDESHNVMTYPDGYPKGAQGFSSPYLTKAGERWSHRFSMSGTYEYHCVPHMFMGMRGRVVVGEASEPENMHKPTRQQVLNYRNHLLQFYDPSFIDEQMGKELKE